MITNRDQFCAHRNGFCASLPGVQQFTCFVAVPILLGAIIYILFRSQHILFLQMLGTIGLQKVVFGLREYLSQVRVPGAILNSLPDGLWVFAFTNWIILIWNGRPPFGWLVFGVVLGIGSEIGQAFSIVPGTFDFRDILFYVAGFALAYITLGTRNEEAFVLARRNDCNGCARFW